jgi:hypothetical protein
VTGRRFALAIPVIALMCAASGVSRRSVAGAQTSRPRPSREAAPPSMFGDQEFWKLMADLSEPAGSFRSDNLVSNEIRFQDVIPALLHSTKPGGVYLGVGPEQNFTYIAAMRPRIAFILDLRRGNVDLHLMYKALFELSADRADFVSRLLSRKRPAGLTAASPAAALFEAFATVEPDERYSTETLAAIRNQLVTEHRFPLSGDDLTRIESIYKVFFLAGTRIQYSPFGSFGGTVQPTYADLMTATDMTGQPRSYLASEPAFRFIKDLERRNALVPVVGDFAGPKALRAIGRFAAARGEAISAFYVSNVEEYLRQNGVWPRFCANVGSLPLAEGSGFIRAVRNTEPGSPAEGFLMRLDPIAGEVRRCIPAGP